MTFARDVHPEQAAKRWARWVRGQERRYAQGLLWVRALEYQRRGVIHYHALLYLYRVRHWSMLQAVDSWERIGQGFCKLARYEPSRGAGSYMAKYLVKGGELDLGGSRFLWAKVAAHLAVEDHNMYGFLDT